VNTIAPGTPLPTYDRGNRLLDALGTLEREAIAAQVFVIDLVSGAVTHEYGALDTWVYFPIDCVLSVVATLEDGQGCEVGTIGNEGASGIPIALGARILRTTICQVAGRTGRLSIDAFVEFFERFSAFREIVLASEDARSFFVEQLVVCNTIHTIEKRCARWLLSLADRKESDTYELTHEYLSFMLGVRRPSVTLAERRLRELGAIEYRYGVIRILDRALLESLACECYRTAAENFQFSIDTSREIHDSNGRPLLLRSSAHGT
jgi:CRP-like cAMP-binding protein